MADPALEDCDQPCVPRFTKNGTNAVVKECPQDLWNEATCFRERDQDKRIYTAVDWSTLAATIKAYFNRFLELLLKDEELSRAVQTAYTYGPYPPQAKWTEGKPARYAEYEAKLITNLDYEKCDNIIVRIVLNRGFVSGRQKQEIAHISLHPPKPKYIREERRSRSGCGYITKRTDANRNAKPEDTSPFMYTVETVEWKGKEIRDDNPNRVNLPFLVDPEQPGKFRPLGARRFEKLFTEGFTNGRSADKLPIDPEQLQRVNDVHTRIYSAFVEFWNTAMLEGSPETGAGIQNALPSIRTSTTGGKRTRKQKRYRKRQTRRRA